MKISYILVILAGIFWGTSGIFVRTLTPYGFTPLQITAYRALFAFILMTIYVFIKEKSAFKIKLKHLYFFALSGLALYGASAAYYSAITLTTVSTAVVVMYTSPVFVLIMSILFFKEKLTILKSVAVGMMVVGCALVSGIVTGFDFNIGGILLALVAAISYGSYSIIVKFQMLRGINALTTTVYSFLFMAIFAVLFANPGEAILITFRNPQEILPLTILLGLCTCFLPYFLYTLSLKKLDAGTASALSIIEPMSACIISIVLKWESLTLYSFIGIVLILVAVLFLSKE